MDKRPPNMPVSVFRGIRLALHLFYAVLLAIFYPHLNQTKRRRILKTWSRQLLDILNIGIRTEGQWPVRGEGGRKHSNCWKAGCAFTLQTRKELRGQSISIFSNADRRNNIR